MKKLLFFSSLLVFVGCSKDSDGPQTTNLTVNFQHTVDMEELIMHPWGMCSQPAGEDCEPGHSCCGEVLNYTNAAGDNYNIETLRYLISNIYLHSSDGSSKLLKEVHFIDAADHSTLTFDAGELDNGTYSKISFTMGLDTSLNTPNRYVNPQNNPIHKHLWWPGDLYHYMKLEGSYDTITQGYKAHTGPTMAMDMSFDKEFDISLNVDDDLGDVNLSVNMEINNWFQNPNTISFDDFPNGMMENMNMQHKFEQNGKSDVFSITTR